MKRFIFTCIRILTLAVFVLICPRPLAADNAQTLIPAGHWVYDAVRDIFSEAGYTAFYTDAPMPQAELELHLSEIDYDALSVYGKTQYDRIYAYVTRKPLSIGSGVVSAGLELALTPELYYKTNPDIDWSFRYHYKDDIAVLPLFLAVSDVLFIESDMFFGKNYWAAREPYNWNNFPFTFIAEPPYLDYNTSEFFFPRRAYMSVGFDIEDTAFFNLQIGRNPFSIGMTQNKSIILSDVFETDGYARFSIFSPNIKYTLTAVQADVEKYLYLHHIQFRLFKKLQLGLIEGAYVNAPFELRFLNPLAIMHQFAFWNSYPDSGINNCSAYFAFTFDYTPVRYLRIYGLYAQNELQLPQESLSTSGKSYPLSLGFQLGAETTVPFKDHGAWHAAVEGVYTMPWLYVKHTPDSSLIRFRNDNLYPTSALITSWIGTPFGPDSIAASAKLGYEVPGKWSVSLAYLWLAQGENAFAENLFFRDGEKLDPDEHHDPDKGDDDRYYPPTYVKDDPDRAIEEANKRTPSGTPQYTNQIQLEGSYSFTENIALAARITYTIVINDDNIDGKFEQGAEFAVSCRFKLL